MTGERPLGPEDWRRSGRTFRYRGHGVFFRRSGAGDPLVLIHGFPTASWDWHRVWDGLAGRFDVIAPDMIGFGFSDKPLPYDYSIMDQADLFEALLMELDVAAVHVLAHDYGVTVAQELLARGGAAVEVRSVCFLNGGIFPGEHRPLAIQKLLMSPIGGLLARMLSERTLRRSFHKIFGPDTHPTAGEVQAFWRLITHNDGRRVIPLLIRYMREREVHRDRWVGALERARVPRRLIVGLADPISGAHVAEVYRRRVPDADVVELQRIGHYPQIEAPAAVLDGVSSFLDGLRA